MSGKEIPVFFWGMLAGLAGLLAVFLYISFSIASWIEVSPSTVQSSLSGTGLWALAMTSLYLGTRWPLQLVSGLFVVCAWPQWFDVIREAADNFATKHSTQWETAHYPWWGTDLALWGSEIALVIGLLCALSYIANRY